MRELYYGVTQQNGATYLNRSLIQVEEGFVIGASTEYISTAQYISSAIGFDNNMSERVSLQGVANRNSTNSINTYLTRTIPARRQFYTDFRTSTEYTDNFTPDFGLDWTPSNSASYLGGSHLLIQNWAYDTSSNLKFTKFTLGDGIYEMKGCLTGGATNNLALGFMLGNFSGQSWTGYTFKMYGGTSSFATGEYYDGTGTSIMFQTNKAYTMGNYFYLRLFKINQRFEFHVATTLPTFTYIGGVTALDGDFESQIGIRAVNNKNAGATVMVDEISFQEMAYQYTTEDIIQYGYNLGNQFDTKYYDEYNFDNSFVGTSGSGWTLGNSILSMGSAASGNSYHYYYLDSQLGDFVADYDVYIGASTSGLYPGFLVGASINNYYQMWNDLGSSSTANFPNGTDYRATDGTVTQQYLKSPFKALYPFRWNRIRAVKDGNNLTSYLNGNLNMFQDISNLTGVTAFIFGFVVYRKGASIGVQFRNFRISKLDNLVKEDVVVDVETNPISLADRYIPKGYDWTQSNNIIETFQIGVSRGIHSITSNYKIVSDSQDNGAGVDLSIFAGKDNRVGISPCHVTPFYILLYYPF